MLGFLRRYRTFLLVLVTLTTPLLVYRAHTRQSFDANPVDRVVLAVCEPLRGFLMGVTGWVSDTWYRYFDLLKAREELGVLSRKAAHLERERDRLSDLGRENETLRRLLQLKQQNPQMRFVAAQVIGVGTSVIARTIEIDQGSVDGVRRGYPVINGQGLIGLVQRVGWTSSEVLLLTDEKMSLYAQVVRTGARGRIRGLGHAVDDQLELSEVLRSQDLKIGDRVMTSGLGRVFPKGLPIGEVITVKSQTGAQHLAAQVVSYVDFGRIEYVSVVISGSREDAIVTPEPLRPAFLQRSGPDGGMTSEEKNDAEKDAGGLQATSSTPSDGGVP